jgi:hypothetical protein
VGGASQHPWNPRFIHSRGKQKMLLFIGLCARSSHRKLSAFARYFHNIDFTDVAIFGCPSLKFSFPCRVLVPAFSWVLLRLFGIVGLEQSTSAHCCLWISATPKHKSEAAKPCNPGSQTIHCNHLKHLFALFQIMHPWLNVHPRGRHFLPQSLTHSFPLQPNRSADHLTKSSCPVHTPSNLSCDLTQWRYFWASMFYAVIV